MTIIDKDGKILFYSFEDFYRRIVIGSDCFICGASQDSKKFNNEHILPDWLLTKYKLHNKTITLANAAQFQYGRYTVPCCEECNSDLGKNIEIPVSKLLKLSYSEICQAITTDQSNLHLLFKWLMLIFFKTHLKDTEFNWNLDPRKGTGKIGETYDWQDMHHIHCMIRKDYTNAIVDTNTIGSIFIVPAIQHTSIEPFDFTDNTDGKTIMIRLDEFCVICVLNDSCGTYSLFKDDIAKIKGALTPFQLREIFTHVVYINLNLKERPVYYSQFSENAEYHIKAKIPETAELVPEEERQITHGELLYHYCKDMIGPVENKKTILNEIKMGKRRYLLNDSGEFINHSKDL